MATWAGAFESALPAMGKDLGSFILQSKAAKSERQWRDYNNRMTQIQNAFNQNAISTNQVLAVQRSAAKQFLISKEEQKTVAAVEASAAATGTTGRSVDKAINTVKYNADRAEAERKLDLENQVAYFINQRQSSQLQAELAIDRSTTPSPSPISLMLGLGERVTTEYRKGRL